jgi:Fur family ferric uptake transcriptional regulator
MTIKEQLRDKKLKVTKYRVTILNQLKKNHRVFTAENLYDCLTERYPNVALSTVYRIIDTFLKNHLIREVILEEENKQYYASYEGRDKHHLICTKCKKVTTLEKCPVKHLAKGLGEHYGFDVTSHQLEFYGLCQDCQKELSHAG